MSRDRRYGLMRWRRLAHWVVHVRDAGICRVVPDCPYPATIADHIVEVYDGMPDSLFFGPGNLRASCAYHNTARGISARLKREQGPEPEKPTAVIVDDYS